MIKIILILQQSQNYWSFVQKKDLKNIAEYQIKIISNDSWHLLAVWTKPACQITNCLWVEKGYILQQIYQ